jgi:Dyp-type peroxidase family
MPPRATDRPPSRSLHAVTELTVIAPLKRGPIAAMDTRSHETRLVAVLRTLDAFRVSSAEIEPTPLIRDVIDRIRGIHSFRLAVVGGLEQRQLLLAVSFDGGWEPYLRRIWRDLGPFLDLLFCNCVGYPLSRQCEFSEYASWVRRSQPTTEFFYHWGAATVNDLVTVFQRQPAAPPADAQALSAERLRQGLQALTGLYRLSEMHPPAALRAQAGLGALPIDDGDTLLNAAQLLLKELRGAEAPALQAALGRPPTPTEASALQWLQGRVAGQPVAPTSPSWTLSQVQAGIVRRLEGVRDAALLLVSFDEPGAAAALMHWLVDDKRLARGDDTFPPPAAGGFYWTVAFSAAGLERLGLDEGLYARLPEEFVQGMAARASVLGDVLHNHPSRWALPHACQPDGSAASPEQRVDLASVHAVLQVAKPGGAAPQPWAEATDPAHPLHPAVLSIAALREQGVRLLSVQTLRRAALRAGEAAARGHFGFVDGLSQPVVRPEGPTPTPPGAHFHDDVPTGDLLLGHTNSLGDKPLSGRLWQNGSFLVMRRLRQDVRAYERALKAAAATLPAALNIVPQGLAELMMGRRADGANLITHQADNNFDYQGDAEGVMCPWQSHVRRSNPRTPPSGTDKVDLGPVPRLVRRGMSFGPPADTEGGTSGEPADAERGLMFMAYNASIAEQFEVLQAWLAGGNSSAPALPSRAADPFLAVRHPGEPARFHFRTPAPAGAGPGFTEHTVSLGTEPFTVLDWGLYLFAPSVHALGELTRIAEDAQDRRQPTALPTGRTAPEELSEGRREALEQERLGLAVRGQGLLRRLRQAEQLMGLDSSAAAAEWKLLLEDPGARRKGLPQMLWAAVRATPGGVMRTPYGVLVGAADRVAEVFADRDRRYTVAGYQARMEASFGPIYLGMDVGEAYEREAREVNHAIMAISAPAAFDAAQSAMTHVLQTLRPAPTALKDETVVDVRDIVDALLAELSRRWFGLPDGRHVQEGGWHWHAAPPRCPGHFHTPSRYLFQPHPGAEATAVGQAHGQQLRHSVRDFVAEHWQQPAALGTLGAAVHAALHGHRAEPAAAQDLVARTLIGVMMGFLPTVDGNLRGLLFDALDDASFWDWRRRLAASPATTGPDSGPDAAWARADAVLRQPLARALQRRPVPDIVWRTVVQAHTLGEVQLQPGEVVAVGIGSALHQRQLEDDISLSALFGGDRREPGQASVPLHACPGQAMALGVMTGALASLMAEPLLRPGPSPALLKLGRA